MIDLAHMEELAKVGPLVLRQEEAREMLAEMRRLRSQAAEHEALDLEERTRACALPLVALHPSEPCPRCLARARAHRNHSSFSEVPRG